MSTITNKPMKGAPPVLTLTGRAVARVSLLLEGAPQGTIGVRVGVRSRGCNGLRYCLDYMDAVAPTDQRLDGTDLPIYIDSKSLLFLIGSEMDWQDEALQSSFVFTNPNETSRCGCGESFSVDDTDS